MYGFQIGDFSPEQTNYPARFYQSVKWGTVPIPDNEMPDFTGAAYDRSWNTYEGNGFEYAAEFSDIIRLHSYPPIISTPPELIISGGGDQTSTTHTATYDSWPLESGGGTGQWNTYTSHIITRSEIQVDGAHFKEVINEQHWNLVYTDDDEYSGGPRPFTIEAGDTYPEEVGFFEVFVPEPSIYNEDLFDNRITTAAMLGALEAKAASEFAKLESFSSQYYSLTRYWEASTSRIQWVIPSDFQGSYVKVMWDVIEELETGETSFYQKDQVWEWTGPGDAEDPDSWISPWFDIPPPPSPGIRGVVNTRVWPHSTGGPFGILPTLQADLYRHPVSALF